MNLKNRVELLLQSTKREGMDDLLAYMDANGFYTSPCSGAYHLAEEGGLAQHSLNVYEYMYKLTEAVKPITPEEDSKIIICALLHDLGKMGQFGKTGYVENILKSGKQSESKPYETNKDLIPVPHEVRSVAIASRFIPLTEEEQFAIMMHNGMYGDLKYSLKGHETPLYLMLHFADMWCARVVEVM